MLTFVTRRNLRKTKIVLVGVSYSLVKRDMVDRFDASVFDVLSV